MSPRGLLAALLNEIYDLRDVDSRGDYVERFLLCMNRKLGGKISIKRLSRSEVWKYIQLMIINQRLRPCYVRM